MRHVSFRSRRSGLVGDLKRKRAGPGDQGPPARERQCARVGHRPQGAPRHLRGGPHSGPQHDQIAALAQGRQGSPVGPRGAIGARRCENHASDPQGLLHLGVHAQVEEALRVGRVVLASASTDRTAGTYRGPLATLRERGDLVVLWPGVGPSSQVAGRSLRPVTDPRALTLPGRGALVSRASALPLQVADETGTTRPETHVPQAPEPPGINDSRL